MIQLFRKDPTGKPSWGPGEYHYATTSVEYASAFPGKVMMEFSVSEDAVIPLEDVLGELALPLLAEEVLLAGALPLPDAASKISALGRKFKLLATDDDCEIRSVICNTAPLRDDGVLWAMSHEDLVSFVRFCKGAELSGRDQMHVLVEDIQLVRPDALGVYDPKDSTHVVLIGQRA